MIDIKPLKFKAASVYPEIVKDVAFVVLKEVSAEEIMREIRRSAGRLLTNIDIFDIYTGPNVLETEKSIAFKLTFQSNERTLNEEEVMTAFTNVINSVKTKLNAKVRDN